MEHDVVTLAHGAGGKLSHALMEEIVLPELGNTILNTLHDGAVLPLTGRAAFTTDSYVVQPHFFSGGSIGRLAVCGTVNDLAMTGAVPRGCGDGIYINTAGVGEMIEGADIAPANIKPGMDIIVSGTLGDHAATVMAARHNLTLPPEIMSDCAPLCHMTAAMLAEAPGIAVLRDPTRGGVAASLNELAGAAGVGILLDEERIPVRPAVQGVCELLGFDPLTLANEGKLLAFTQPADTERVLRVMHADPHGTEACVIGQTTAEAPGEVGLRTALGGIRVVDMPLGELVPRIC